MRATFAFLLHFLFLLHCSSTTTILQPQGTSNDAGAGDDDAASPPAGDDASSDGTVALTEPRCAPLCTKLQTAHCSSLGACESQCNAEAASLPAYCKTYWNAFYTCVTSPSATASSCSSTGKPNITGCTQQSLLLASCEQTDAAAPGTCQQYKDPQANGNCLYCIVAGCCTQAAQCTPGTLCDQYLTCIDGCVQGDTTCRQTCANNHPLGVADAQALTQCVQGVCYSQCV
jgi:hypothetical protein